MLLDFQNRKIHKRFEYKFCSDEIYSPFAENIIKAKMRYIDWYSRNRGSKPCYLDYTDFAPLTEANYLFARQSNFECINSFTASQNKVFDTDYNID